MVFWVYQVYSRKHSFCDHKIDHQRHALSRLMSVQRDKKQTYKDHRLYNPVDVHHCWWQRIHHKLNNLWWQARPREDDVFVPPPHINLHCKCRGNPSDATQSNIMTGRGQLRKPIVFQISEAFILLQLSTDSVKRVSSHHCHCEEILMVHIN